MVEGLKRAKEIIEGELKYAKAVNTVMAMGISQVLMLIEKEIKISELVKINSQAESKITNSLMDLNKKELRISELLNSNSVLEAKIKECLKEKYVEKILNSDLLLNKTLL